MKKTIPIAVLAALVATAPADARRGGDDDDRREVRVAGSCGPGATSKLKLKQRDGGIEAEFEVDRNVSGEKWKVTFARDGSVVARGSGRTNQRSGSVSIERRFSDLSGADTVTARGTGPDGRTCSATATLPE